MLKHTVVVQITGANPFWAGVELDSDDLNPGSPPVHLTGIFTEFSGYELISKALVHILPFDGGSSHTMYVCEGRHGYHFTMEAPDTDRFKATLIDVKSTFSGP